MSEATDADREKAHLVLGYGPSTTRTYLTIEYARVEGVAAALAEEREKARAPFLALIPKLQEEGRNSGEDPYRAGLDVAAEWIREIAEETE